MSGVAILRARLVANAAVIAVVPATNIRADDVPLRAAMPWISLEQVSLSERMNVEMSDSLMQRESVRLTILAATYLDQRSIDRLVETACQTVRGDVGGFDVDSILPNRDSSDDIIPRVGVYAKSVEYIVRFYE